MPMKNPLHPGKHVRMNCLEPLSLSLTKAAMALGVARYTLNKLVNGRSGISPEVANQATINPYRIPDIRASKADTYTGV